MPRSRIQLSVLFQLDQSTSDLVGHTPFCSVHQGSEPPASSTATKALLLVLKCHVMVMDPGLTGEIPECDGVTVSNHFTLSQLVHQDKHSWYHR